MPNINISPQAQEGRAWKMEVDRYLPFHLSLIVPKHGQLK